MRITDATVSCACDAFLRANRAAGTVGFKEMRAALEAVFPSLIAERDALKAERDEWITTAVNQQKRAKCAEAEVTSLRARVEEAEVIISKIPGALSSQFSAGVEEREGGSARRQERYMEAGEELRRMAAAWSTASAVKGGSDAADE